MSMQQWAESQANPEIVVNRNFQTTEHQSVYGQRQSAHSGLTWGYYGGPRWGGNATSNGTLTLADNATNYIVVARATGAISVSTSTTNWDNTTDYARVYKVVTASGVVTNNGGADFDYRAGPYGVHGQSSPTGGTADAADIGIADAGTYYTGTDVEAALQEIGAALAAVPKIPAVRYTVDKDSTADSDPGSGLLKFNNATPSSATFLYVDDATVDSIDLSTFFTGLGSSGWIKLFSKLDAGEWMLFKWSAVTDGTGYFKFAVTHQASNGTLDDADEIYVSFDSDATAAGGASTTQTGECIAGFIGSPSNKDYKIVVKAPHGGTITETTTISASGTCTATFKINTTALGGTANSVSSSEQSQAQASSNVFSAGDDIVITVSSNSSCADMSFSIKYTRTLA